jgi:serine/threonine protein kinase
MAETWKRWEGQVVNEEFPLRRYLGGSDHSAVFLTERGEPDPQKAAIKLIPVNAEDPEIQLSWWELAAKLSHPHLLRLAQRGRCQMDDTEMLYAVSEYADENLAQILPQRALSPPETLDMLRAVLSALAYIHGKGFVHGHIKPSNIMAVGDQVKISSDGLCGPGESSRVLGPSAIYTAPEIASGGGMSSASDVWSLGMTLVEAMTQRPPIWDGTDQSEPVVPETLPAHFLEIARHCLRQDPRQRWTVGEIAASLPAASPASGEVETSKPPKAATESRYIIGAAAVGLLLLAIVAVPRIFKHHQDSEPVPSMAPNSSKAELSSEITRKEQTPTVGSTSKHRASVQASASDEARSEGTAVGRVVPEVSRSARNTIHGKIKVSVKVTADESGNVMSARFVSHGPSMYFAKLAMQSAQRWTFKPPQVAGQGVPSEWILKYEFTRTATTVHPTQTSP